MEKLTENDKATLRKMVNFTCEVCGQAEDEFQAKLVVHRIKRGNVGGKYHLRNIKMVCVDCHKQIHANELH